MTMLTNNAAVTVKTDGADGLVVTVAFTDGRTVVRTARSMAAALKAVDEVLG